MGELLLRELLRVVQHRHPDVLQLDPLRSFELLRWMTKLNVCETKGTTEINVYARISLSALLKAGPCDGNQ